MPLYVDLTANNAAAETDLFQIVRCDTGLGDQNVPNDASAARVTYTKGTSGAGQDRIAALVAIGLPVVISAVDSTYVFPDGTPILSIAGGTYMDGAIVRTVYDVSQAAAQQYYVFDNSGDEISFPNPVLLFHELSHAYHLAKGDSPPPGPAAEFQAETDENSFRGEVGLTLRNPNNHNGGYGLAGGEQVPSCTPGLGPIKCFVVSAAIGSADAPEVHGFRAARDRLAAESQLCSAFSRELMAEYYAFSPRIAADMMRSAALRRCMRDWFVTPLLGYADFFQNYVASGGDADRFICSIEPAIRDVLSNLQTQNAQHDTISGIAAASESLAARLAENGRELPTRAVPAIPADDAFAPIEVFEYVAEMIEGTIGAAPYVAWAARALAFFWAAASIFARGGNKCEIEKLARRIDDWLSSIPIPETITVLPASDLVRELSVLGQSVFCNPDIRGVVARRIRRRYGANMDIALEAAGYFTEGC